MVSVFGSLGIGLGIDYVCRAAGGTPQTLVASVHIIGPVTSKWTFDYPIEYTEAGAAFARVGEVNCDLVPDTVGADYVIFTHSEPVSDETTWELMSVPAELTSPGRTIPAPQSGAAINNKVLVVSVVVVEGESRTAEWVFDHDVTTTGVPTDLLVGSAAPLNVTQVNVSTIRLEYEEPVEGLEWSAEGTTNLTLPDDHYLYPGQLGTAAG